MKWNRIATLIDRALLAKNDEGGLAKIRREVKALCDQFPLWG
jgi:glycine/serine hydroxymethyltransferase